MNFYVIITAVVDSINIFPILYRKKNLQQQFFVSIQIFYYYYSIYQYKKLAKIVNPILNYTNSKKYNYFFNLQIIFLSRIYKIILKILNKVISIGKFDIFVIYNYNNYIICKLKNSYIF